MFSCITIDADWAHPEVTAYTMSILEEVGVKYTFFATEDQNTDVSSLCELAWHPNFGRQACVDELNLFSSLMPGVAGMRPHRLSWASCSHETVLSYDVKWTSSFYDKSSCTPVKRGSLLDVPIAWGDNRFFLENIEPDFTTMDSNVEGIYVLNFHPIHIFLNTCCLDQYIRAKELCLEPEKIAASCVNKDKRGVCDVFETVLNIAKDAPEHFLTISCALKMGSYV